MNNLRIAWSTMIIPNEILIKFIGIPLTFFDIYICMLFFSSILNIDISKNRKIVYVTIYGILANIINFIVSPSYQVYINIILWPIMVFFLLKTTILKSILSVIITMITTSTLDFVFTQSIQKLFNTTFDIMIVTPIYRIAIALCIYSIIYILTKLINYFKINIEFFDNMHTKYKILLCVNLLLLIMVLSIQFYLIAFYSTTLPFYVSLSSTIGLIAYFSVSIYNIISTSKLAFTARELQSTQNELHTITILHNRVTSFNHDFNNIVHSIGGYITTKDMDGLKRYYNQILEECNKTNNLYALSPNVINHPAIYNLLATKYYEADQKNIVINLHVILDLNEIERHMKIYDCTRILGILLDNAIEASEECDKKVINVSFRKDIVNDMLLIIIQNTYANKDVDTETIFQKGISTKENHSGLGLWKVREILMHNNNLNLFTTKNDEFFTQQFEIYI